MIGNDQIVSVYLEKLCASEIKLHSLASLLSKEHPEKAEELAVRIPERISEDTIGITIYRL